MLPKLIGVALGLLLCGITAIALAKPDRPFSFVSQDHPVEMWSTGKDKWAYFSEGDSISEMLTTARPELLAQGYVEDRTQRPWFRFTKGSKEVIICNHHEFAVNTTGPFSGKLMKPGPMMGSAPTKPWACVLVKNGPGTSMNLAAFQVKKLALGW